MAGYLDSAVVVTGHLGAASFGLLACLQLEGCLGAYPVDFSSCWALPECWDADDRALEMSDYANIWTDGSREDFSSVGGFEVAGAGVYLPAAEVAFEGAVWCVAEEYGNVRLERCRAFMPVLGVLHTVQRAEFWGAILALQAYWPCHWALIISMLLRLLEGYWIGVVLLNHCRWFKDGDLVALAQHMICTRGRDTVRVTNVKSCH